MPTKPATWTRVKGAKKVRGPEKKPARKFLRKATPQMEKLRRQWHKLRDAFLLQNPMCQCCKVCKATEVHHRRGRGPFLLTVETFMSTCWACHKLIHEQPAWSEAKGYMVSRLAKI
jgi:hypothetical protein